MKEITYIEPQVTEIDYRDEESFANYKQAALSFKGAAAVSETILKIFTKRSDTVEDISH